MVRIPASYLIGAREVTTHELNKEVGLIGVIRYNISLIFSLLILILMKGALKFGGVKHGNMCMVAYILVVYKREVVKIYNFLDLKYGGVLA